MTLALYVHFFFPNCNDVTETKTQMAEGTKWPETSSALSGIADLAMKYDTDGVDMYFMNNAAKATKIKVSRLLKVSLFFFVIYYINFDQGAATIASTFAIIGKPVGKFAFTVIYRWGIYVLISINRQVVPPLVPKSRNVWTHTSLCSTPPLGSRNTGRSSHLILSFLPMEFPVSPHAHICPTKEEKLNFTLLADAPLPVLEAAAAQMRAAKHHPNHIGIQFVQIGNDAGAGAALIALTKGNVNGMVDTIPYHGPVTAAELERILLGGIHPNIRTTNP